MDKLEVQSPPNKKKFWQYLLILVVLGLAVNLLLPQISDLTRSWEVIKQMTWWAVGLAFVFLVLEYFSYGYCIHAIVNLHDKKLTTPKGTLIVMAATSVGLVAGGWFAVAGSIFGSVRRETNDGATATMAGILPSMLLNLSIEIVAILGIIYLSIIRKLTGGQLIQYIIFILLLTIATFGYLLALVLPRQTFRIINGVLWRWNRFRKKPYNPQETQDMINNVILSWKELARGNWKQPFLGAFGYILFDMLVMFLFFKAVGYNIPIGVLFASYGIPFLLSKIAFIFPGGIGVVEASMAAIQTSLGVPNEISVVAILGYRLFSFWIPTLLGFAAMGFLSRSKTGLEPVPQK
ncbi:MAG: YbhN family protein [Anaerolineaceae bacterium]